MLGSYYLTKEEYANYTQALSLLTEYQVYPQVLMGYGRLNMPIQIPITDLLINSETTYSELATTLTSITVANPNSFEVNDYILVGAQYSETAEITKITVITGNTFTVETMARVHPTSTQITKMAYNKVEISNSANPTSAKTVLVLKDLEADNDVTYMPSVKTGYYYARYYNSTTLQYSDYSEALPITGYNKNMARAIIDNALMGINKEINATLTDEFMFVQLNNCLEEVQKAAKRYNCFQRNRYPIPVNPGQITYDLPADIDNNQAYILEYDEVMGYLDNQVFATLIPFRTVLTQPLGVGSGTVHVENSRDFPSRLNIYGSTPNTTVFGTPGTTQYSYQLEVQTQNGWTRPVGTQVTTGPATLDLVNYIEVYWDEYPGATDYRVYRTEGGTLGLIYQNTNTSFNDIGLTVLSPIEAPQAIGSINVGGVNMPYIENINNIFYLQYPSPASGVTGADVLYSVKPGQPSYYTLQGNKVIIFPVPLSARNMYLTYYASNSYMNRDQDVIPFDNTMVAVYYLQWKALVKQNNGMITPESEEKRKLFEAQMYLLRTKDRNGITRLLPVQRNWKF